MKGIAGKQVLVDTNILIYQLNGKIDLAEELARARKLYISAITEAELYAGVDRKQLLNLKDYLESFSIIPVTSEIAKMAGAYKATFKKQGLKDLIIAATAQLYKLTLVTANKKDFYGLTLVKSVFIKI
jgi:predicted nucleic acid-binding protein